MTIRLTHVHRYMLVGLFAVVVGTACSAGGTAAPAGAPEGAPRPVTNPEPVRAGGAASSATLTPTPGR